MTLWRKTVKIRKCNFMSSCKINKEHFDLRQSQLKVQWNIVGLETSVASTPTFVTGSDGCAVFGVLFLKDCNLTRENHKDTLIVAWLMTKVAQIKDSWGLKETFKILHNSQTSTTIIPSEPYPWVPHPDTVGLQPNIVQESQHSWGPSGLHVEFRMWAFV